MKIRGDVAEKMQLSDGNSAVANVWVVINHCYKSLYC